MCQYFDHKNKEMLQLLNIEDYGNNNAVIVGVLYREKNRWWYDITEACRDLTKANLFELVRLVHSSYFLFPLFTERMQAQTNTVSILAINKKYLLVTNPGKISFILGVADEREGHAKKIDFNLHVLSSDREVFVMSSLHKKLFFDHIDGTSSLLICHRGEKSQNLGKDVYRSQTIDVDLSRLRWHREKPQRLLFFDYCAGWSCSI